MRKWGILDGKEVCAMKNDKVMFARSYGMFVLTTREGEKDNGCIINTAMQVTVKPNRILFTVDKANLTCGMVRGSGKFTLSILSEEAGEDLYRRFGFQSGRDVDKFKDFPGAERGENGIMRLTKGCNGWISGKVVSETDLGTHVLFLADVTDGDVTAAEPSATYAYYHAHVKPKPTAQAAPAGKKRWVCKVCGYVYEGDALPADYICPICKHRAEDCELMP